MILVICSAYSFLGNSALLGPSVYIGLYSEEFGVTPTDASGLISYPNLAFGFGLFLLLVLSLFFANHDLPLVGSLLLVPLYLKIGRRPVMLGSLLCVSFTYSLFLKYSALAND